MLWSSIVLVIEISLTFWAECSHRQIEVTPRTIFVKTHRPVHTTITWWESFTNHCVMQYRQQKALV